MLLSDHLPFDRKLRELVLWVEVEVDVHCHNGVEGEEQGNHPLDLGGQRVQIRHHFQRGSSNGRWDVHITVCEGDVRVTRVRLN